MGEFHEDLNREAGRVSGDPGALDKVMARAGRRRVRRQIATGVVALAIAGGSFALAFAAFQGPGTSRPAIGPSPTDPVVVRVLDGTGDPPTAVGAATLLAKAGYEVVPRVGDAGHIYETTTIACTSDYDDEAADIADHLGVDAEVTATIPDPAYDVTVYIGTDYPTADIDELKGWIEGFIAARDGLAAAEYVGAARDDFFETSNRAEPRPNELFLYGDGGLLGYRVDKVDRLTERRWRAEVRITWGNAGPCFRRVAIERLTIWEPSDGTFRLLDARLLDERFACLLDR